MINYQTVFLIFQKKSRPEPNMFPFIAVGCYFRVDLDQNSDRRKFPRVSSPHLQLFSTVMIFLCSFIDFNLRKLGSEYNTTMKVPEGA